MRDAMQKTNCDRDLAFQMTQKTGLQEFNNRLRKICEKCDVSANHVVFVDKNIPKDQIERVISDI